MDAGFHRSAPQRDPRRPPRAPADFCHATNFRIFEFRAGAHLVSEGPEQWRLSLCFRVERQLSAEKGRDGAEVDQAESFCNLGAFLRLAMPSCWICIFAIPVDALLSEEVPNRIGEAGAGHLLSHLRIRREFEFVSQTAMLRVFQ